MFDVSVDGKEYRESEAEAPGDEIVLSETPIGRRLGLTVCYDLRFPELFRILAVARRARDRAAGGLHQSHRRRRTGRS